MAADGTGSQRIVLVGKRPRAREPQRSDEPAETDPPAQQPGWTVRRLTIAGALGAAATIAGGIVFVSRFGVFGASDSPFLAVGFGLFVIGMIVFCACLIALLGIGVGAVAERRGWPAAATMVLGPLALAWALWVLGAVGYAVPAVLSLVLIGGLVVALK